MRRLVFIAASQKDLRSLPKAAQDDIGYELFLAQTGQMPPHAKPLKGFGGGMFEIALELQQGAFRAAYVIRLQNALYVFQKKSKSGIATPKPDLNLIWERLKRAEELDKAG